MPTEILLHDEIGPAYYGLQDAKWLASEVKRANGGDILLRINSPGGSVVEAQAMYTELRLAQVKGQKINVQIDALAASAASFLAMVGDSITIAENAMVMIHKAWTISMGNADDMQATADTLRKFDGILTDIYAARTGQTAQQIAEWMAAETWMTASEAIERGFADSISTTIKGAKASVRPDAFKNTPRDLVSEPSPLLISARRAARNIALAKARYS